ncbi:MAG TPA: DUF4190 domain-containing protein [Verrucomicrobiae bacterium]|nr:DUF4190 domain-containing protein [Verrucomicrobiae bacterium]
MYRIIGADGKEYGPASAEQMREWQAQGRVNADTAVLLEGDNSWKRFRDFAELNPAPAAPAPSPFPAAAVAAPPTDPLAVAGLVLGILSVIFSCCCYGLPFNIAGIVCSAVALSRINRYPELWGGRSLAVAGLILSILSIILAIVLFTFGIALRSSGLFRKIQRL